ncbi:MAG: Maf family protein, partial [Planctomycetota bacterium]|nr:Maf family protein [Planctomycetota bacterium]
GSLVLASSSARRRAMLAEAGFDAVSIAPLVDDGGLIVRADHTAEDCCALAWFKGVQIMNDLARLKLQAPDARIILSADTVCVLNGNVMGKPRDASHARRMLEAARNQSQKVVTGVCIIGIAEKSRAMLADSAEVRFGAISDRQMNAHLECGGWSGRAGGYNIEELVAAGWPVEWSGDQSTVTGLPMKMLKPILTRMLGCTVVGS